MIISKQEGPISLTGVLAHMMYWPVVKEISAEDISILALVAILFAELNILINFGRRHQAKHFCETILNMEQTFKRKCCLKTFLI